MSSYRLRAGSPVVWRWVRRKGGGHATGTTESGAGVGVMPVPRMSVHHGATRSRRLARMCNICACFVRFARRRATWSAAPPR